MPLILEFIVTALFKPTSSMLLEQTSVMITAPMFAVGVGMASRFKAVFGLSLVVAFGLTVVYGAQIASQPSANMSAARNAEIHHEEQPRSFSDKIGMHYWPEKVAWYGMGIMTLLMMTERGIRHLRLAEPYEFEWNK